MQKKKGDIQQYAMMFGTFMGVFWIGKFAFLPLGLTRPYLSFLFMCLTLCVPFVGYHYARLYRNKVCGGGITWGHAWIFTLLVYVYAALLTAVAHYVYFRYIDQGYMLQTCRDMWEHLQHTPGMEATGLGQIEEALDAMERLTPVDIMLNMFWTNIYSGFILSLLTALFVVKKPVSEQNHIN